MLNQLFNAMNNDTRIFNLLVSKGFILSSNPLKLSDLDAICKLAKLNVNDFRDYVGTPKYMFMSQLLSEGYKGVE